VSFFRLPAVAAVEQGSSGEDSASGRRPGGEDSPGLVYSKTSETPGSFRLTPDASRQKRKRRRLLTACRLHDAVDPSWRAAMITFTYRPGETYRPRDIVGFNDRVRH
jgi:hypothetical protein